MIDPEHGLSIQKQAEVLEISRSTVYYRPRPVSALDLWRMRKLDELHLNYPFAGSRMLRDRLSRRGLEVGRRHVRTLMRKMASPAIGRRNLGEGIEFNPQLNPHDDPPCSTYMALGSSRNAVSR